jgi:hypothetical protein
MKVKVNKLTDYSLMKEAMEFTSGRDIKLNRANMEWMYDAEHSPIRTQLFVVKMYEIPTYVSVHFVRHKVGIEHFVKSNRDKNIPIDRNTPVNHMMVLNSHALMNMSHDRLCKTADKVTVQVMNMIKGEIQAVDSILANFLIPKCEYRGKCPERRGCNAINNHS